MVRRNKQQNQAVQAPRGLPQGDRKKITEAQQAIPLPNEEGQRNAVVDQATAMPSPALLTQPTVRPDEPLTAGMGLGPGPGVEAVAPVVRPMQADIVGMAKFLPMLEALANQPDASSATRNFVRRLRGTMPPEVTMQALVGRNGAPPG